eukprot:CAMPEP_0180822962 /NCGR_PEP_ID=MMETSP1038_2-20121128/71639_1 /TAXON_ID=632150 /ORGANISM="Azadinium spinosum, Strain 3D9" /LENGTH=175 /DNA_ID=CAMNT_0022865237 /DNA_START=101 /DNA_END=625 /DNA_ORIENTATION=-
MKTDEADFLGSLDYVLFSDGSSHPRVKRNDRLRVCLSSQNVRRWAPRQNYQWWVAEVAAFDKEMSEKGDVPKWVRLKWADKRFKDKKCGWVDIYELQWSFDSPLWTTSPILVDFEKVASSLIDLKWGCWKNGTDLPQTACVRFWLEARFFGTSSMGRAGDRRMAKRQKQCGARYV